MSFGITVFRRTDEAFLKSPPPQGGREILERWVSECQARWLYENPLGSEGDVWNYWHVPSNNLRLPLLAAIYNHGLRIEGLQLSQLARELDALDAFWNTQKFVPAEPAQYSEPSAEGETPLLPLREYLQERFGYLREAIRVAQQFDAVLTIG